MLRAIVEEAAALASLALFLGMIAIWAHVIATPEPAAHSNHLKVLAAQGYLSWRMGYP
jgi:hypothetical protein